MGELYPKKIWIVLIAKPLTSLAEKYRISFSHIVDASVEFPYDEICKYDFLQ